MGADYRTDRVFYGEGRGTDTVARAAAKALAFDLSVKSISGPEE